MLSGKVLLYVVLLAAWQSAPAQCASLPILPSRIGSVFQIGLDDGGDMSPPEITWAQVREEVCVGHCASPPRGPVCAFDATGTARTFATLCELEAVSCRERTYYAITSLGEC